MSEFDNLYAHGFIRAAACSPRVTLADPHANADATIALMKQAHAQGAALLVCPELGLSGYSIDDLHMQAALLTAVDDALAKIIAASKSLMTLTAVGAPIKVGSAIFNCAVVIHRGRLLGVIPKSYLPNYREYYEKRQFAAARDALVDTITVAGQSAPFGTNLLFKASDAPDFVAGFEICEDLWAPVPPASFAALAGATVIGNLSASNITIGKADERSLLCASISNRCQCAYLYAAAGAGESTTDVAWDGQLSIFELGAALAQSERFPEDSLLLTADIDVERIVQDRIRLPTFRDVATDHRERTANFCTIEFALAPQLDKPLKLNRIIDRFPYVPDDAARLDQDCYEAYNIQVRGLKQRLTATKIPKLVIGVSGGLDSTQALLVACRAFDLMKRKRSDIIGVTMPGFATGDASKSHAHALMKELGVDAREVDIKPMAMQMFKDLGHPFAEGKKQYDVTFENVQAGLRTDYLFRLANQENAIVLGTGDLSELALGWCTYGVGDHMSHYNVNGSVSKTLIQHLIRWCATGDHYSKAAAKTLLAILDSEISPELIPAGADGKAQSTQGTIGPYELHDFTLYYVTRFGLSPTKIAYLASNAWGDPKRGHWPQNIRETERRAYDVATIIKWLEVFAQRFYATSQFKRSAMPNGPKISSGGSLSPRGDWRAPSDASATVWLEDISRLKQALGLEKA